MAEAYSDVNHITFSYNIFSEAPSVIEESEGVLVGTGGGCDVWAQDITLHHNLFAHNHERNPRWILQPPILAPKPLNIPG